MNNIDYLKQYNSKSRELKKVSNRIKEIDIRLNNWDKLKAATITDMPTHHDTEHGDKVGDIVAGREELEQERLLLEVQQADLVSYIINVDTLLECLEYRYKYLLSKIYIEGHIGKRHRESLHAMYTKDVKMIERDRLYKLIVIAEKEFNRLT